MKNNTIQIHSLNINKTKSKHFFDFILTVVILLFYPLAAQANFIDNPTDPGGWDETPVASIDSWIIPSLVLAIVVLFFYFRKKQLTQIHKR